jgi:hypothetical protein
VRSVSTTLTPTPVLRLVLVCAAVLVLGLLGAALLNAQTGPKVTVLSTTSAPTASAGSRTLLTHLDVNADGTRAVSICAADNCYGAALAASTTNAHSTYVVRVPQAATTGRRLTVRVCDSHGCNAAPANPQY